MKITIHRGTNQIGGCVTEYEYKGWHLFVDYGEELPGGPKTGDLQVEGLTHGDLSKSALLITHYHGDHIGNITKLSDSLPIYMGEVARDMALPTSSALQFYMIMSGQEKPFKLSIAELKSWLGIPQDKYRKDGRDRIDHLEERVLRPVKRMLDETCPYTFTYEKLRENQNNSKSPVVGFELRPVYQAKFRDQELERVHLTAKVSIGFISPQVINYMKQQMGFDKKSLSPHKDLLIQAVNLLPDVLGTLADIQGRRRKPNGTEMGIGWVIQAIKGEVKKAEKALEKSSVKK